MSKLSFCKKITWCALSKLLGQLLKMRGSQLSFLYLKNAVIIALQRERERERE